MGDCYIARRVSLQGINLLSPTCVQLREGAIIAADKDKARESVNDRMHNRQNSGGNQIKTALVIKSK